MSQATVTALNRIANAIEQLTPLTSEQALLESAGAHAKRTSWSFNKWLTRIQTDPTYNYQATEWYLALGDLEAVKHLAPPPQPATDAYLEFARARIFLAHDPLESLAAPTWMTPVCTADLAYRQHYPPDVINRLRRRFGKVEAWCDCVNTPYHEAQRMTDDLQLDGPPWGQCETTTEFDTAYAAGARRMVGSVDASVLDDQRLARVASAEVLVSVELYRNCQPNMQPDWRNANHGIGGNCIGIYQDATCTYTSVQSYRAQGLYVPHHDSVYGVGLEADDWAALA